MRSTGLLFLASWLIPVGICCWYLSMPGGDFLASIVFVLWVGLYCIIWVGRFLVAIAVGLFYRCAGKVARQPGWYLVPLLAGALSALATRVDWPAARMWWYRNDLNALAEVGAGTHDSVRVPTVVSALGGTHGGANPNGGKIAGMTVRSVQAAHEISEDWNIHRTGPEGIAMLRSLSQSKGFVLWLHDPGAFWDEIGLIYIPEEDLRGECARSWRSLGNGWYQIRRVD